MQDKYTKELVIRIINNRERIKSFLERITNELFLVDYAKTDPEFYMQEGHTLWNPSPQNSRIPSKDEMKNNLAVLLYDIDRALEILDPMDKMKVLIQYSDYAGEVDAYHNADPLIYKLLEFLNGHRDLSQKYP